MTSSSSSDGTKPMSFRFADAVQAIHSSLRGGHSHSQQQQHSHQSESETRQLPLLRATHISSTVPDSFPELQLDRLGNVLHLDETAQGQIKAAHDEAKLNWDLDAKLVGGHRSDSNIGMARVFGLLNVIGVADEGDSVERGASQGRKYDADGNLIIAARQDGTRQHGSGGEPGGPGVDEARGTQEVFHRQYETHDLLRAIDRKDTQTILMIRDANFDLLLDLHQGGKGASMSSGTVNTPLGYCIGLGRGWEGVAVVLTGALSKFVNNLPDEEEEEAVDTSEHKVKPKRVRRELDPRTMSRLRKLRTSLKLAIDHSISIDQTRLLSSYLQVLLMSTGQTFIRETTDSVHQALVTLFSGSQVSSDGVIRSSTDPFQVASHSITSFFTESLKTKSQLKDVSQRIASVDDLIDNCVGDFIIMAVWQDVRFHRKEIARLDDQDKRKQVDARAEDDQLFVELPTWSFARDDRISTIFNERVGSLQKVLDLVQWESKGRLATSATKSSRNVRIWNCAQEIVEHFGTRQKRLSSKDRLSLLRSLIH